MTSHPISHHHCFFFSSLPASQLQLVPTTLTVMPRRISIICDCEDDANVDDGERGNYRGIKMVIMPMRRISINIFLTVATVTMSNDDIVDNDFS